MIRPAADRKNAFLRCRGHALTMARRIGRLPTPWTVSTPHRPGGISVLSNFYDRQVLFAGISAVPTAGNRRRVNLRKKTRERTRPCWASSNFSCLCSSRLSCFRRAALGARRYFFEPGMGAINFLSPESLPQVPHTSGFTPGELLHRNGLCIRKLFIPALADSRPPCYTGFSNPQRERREQHDELELAGSRRCGRSDLYGRRLGTQRAVRTESDGEPRRRRGFFFFRPGA